MAAELRCDGVRVPFATYTVIYASTIEDIGLGFRPTYRARERPGHFHVFAGPIGAARVPALPAGDQARPADPLGAGPRRPGAHRAR